VVLAPAVPNVALHIRASVPGLPLLSWVRVRYHAGCQVMCSHVNGIQSAPYVSDGFGSAGRISHNRLVLACPGPRRGRGAPICFRKGGPCQVGKHTFPAPADCAQPLFKPSITRSYCTQGRRGPSDKVPIPDSSQGTSIAKVTEAKPYFAHSNA